MNSPSQKLNLAVKAYHSMTNISWHGGEIQGSLMLTQENLELLKELDNEELIYPTIKLKNKTVTISDLLSIKQIGQNIGIRLQPPRHSTGQAFFAKDFNDLFGVTMYQHLEPDSYYIADCDYLKGQEDIPQNVKRYSRTICLVRTLQEIADYADEKADKLSLIFLAKSKLVISINYTSVDTTELNLLESFSTLLTSEPHREQKTEILKSVLYDMCINVRPEERFRHLLSSFDECYRRFKENYQLFLREFSFEKIREEVEDRKLEFTTKLNKVFSEIQNKILTIPLALILIGSQLENKSAITLKNIIIITGAFIFTILMILLLVNQKHTLNAIYESIENERSRLSLRYANLFKKFNDTFKSLENRYVQQVRLLRIVWILVIISLLFSVTIFISYSPELKGPVERSFQLIFSDR